MPELLTAKQVKEEFGHSRSSLLRWESAGLLFPFKTPGGQRRYDRASLRTLTRSTAKTDGGAPPPAPDRPDYNELGVTGLRKWGGSVYEESQKELRGRNGRKIFREMRLNDPVIAAVFFAIENSLKQAAWRVSPASEAPPDREAAEFVESALHDMSWSWHDQLSFILEMLEQGFSVEELVYKRRLGAHPPKYVPDPAASQHEDGRVGWRKWAPRPAESLAEGQEWVFDDAGGIQGIRQQPEAWGAVRDPIPIRKLLLFRTTVVPANNPEGRPIHRASYLPWYYSNNMQEIEGIGVERDLAGIPIVYLGTDCTLSGTNSDFELAKDLVVNLRADEQAGVVVPKPKMGMAGEGQGMLVELLTAGGSREHDVGKIVERYDKRKALTVLAQFIMLGMEQVGSFALSRSQNDLFVISATAWLLSIADVINRHAIPRLMRYNVFPGVTGIPELVPGSVGIPDLAGVGEYVNRMVERQVITVDAELERHMRQLAGLPARPVALGEGEPVQPRPPEEADAQGQAKERILKAQNPAKPNWTDVADAWREAGVMTLADLTLLRDARDEGWSLSEFVEKSHKAVPIAHACPLCGHGEADGYEGHGGLLVCTSCGKTYDPRIERWQRNG